MNTNDLLKRAQKLVIDNSPAILTAIGVTGTLATAYLTGTASFKAARIIRDVNDGLEVKMGAKEELSLVWRLYIPAAVAGTATVVAIVGANRIGNRRAAAVAVMYTLSEKAYAEYRDKIREKIGEKKESAARDEITQERAAKIPLVDREVILTGHGKDLCLDLYTGRYFRSDIETLRRAENDVNELIFNHGFVSLSEFYQMIGLKPTSVSDDIGWTTDRFLKLRITSIITDENQICVSMDINQGTTRI